MLKTGLRIAAAILIVLLGINPRVYGAAMHRDTVTNHGDQDSDSKLLVVQLLLTAEEVSEKLPSGTVLRQSEFTSFLGKRYSNALCQVDVTSISNTGGHFTIEFAGSGFEGDVDFFHVKFRQHVQCDVRTSPGGTEITNLRGMEVTAPLVPGISVKKLVLSAGTVRGNVIVHAQVVVMGFIPVTYIITARADGGTAVKKNGM